MRQMRKLMAIRRNNSRSSRLRILPGGRVVEEVLARRRRVGAGPMDVPGRIDPERQVFQFRAATRSRTAASNAAALLNTLPLFRFARGKKHRPLAGHFPSQPAAQKFPPAQAQFPQLRIVALGPTGNLHQQRPLRQPPILVEMFQRIAGKQMPLAVEKQFLQPQVDRPHRAMKIDRPKQFRPHRDEPHQGRKPPLVNGQSLGVNAL